MEVKTTRFNKDELKCKCCGMYNVSDEHLINLDVLANAYNNYLFSNSTCRCLKHNKNVGGVDTSRHQCETKQADATDIRPRYIDDEQFINELYEIYKLACDMRVFKEVIFYLNTKRKEDSFVHVATYKDKPFPYKHIKVI